LSALRVLTIAGTRPELIRLSRLIPLLDSVSEHHFAYTGQNFNSQLRDVFFQDLGIRAPDSEFGVSTDSFGRTMSDTILKSETLIREFRPDAVVILGDTNSSIAALPAERLGVPVFHLEAGNRSFDANVPEELNRKLIDHIATFNLPYSEHARRNLLAEGINPRQIFLSGSPMAEILNFYADKISESKILDTLDITKNNYFLASIHRQENVDSQERLESVFSALSYLSNHHDLPVIVSTHPRTKMRLEQVDESAFKGLIFLDPFGYFDYMKLQMSARCVISDSGTISEESAICGFPAVTLRNSMERPEALESGSILMSRADGRELSNVVEFARSAPLSVNLISDYQITDFSHRVASLILSTAKLAPNWLNRQS
jgi:UDP-N-acetylglucosamine 2-epimerase